LGLRLRDREEAGAEARRRDDRLANQAHAHERILYLAVSGEQGPQAGIQGRMEVVIDHRHLTTHVGGRGGVSTPSMIGLMEITAHDSVAGLLQDGQTTVGYEVCVRHLARADPGERIVVSSTLTE